MYQQSPESNERLNLAAEALRDSPIRDEVLLRGQRAIMTRTPVKRAGLNLRLVWVSGTCVALCGAISFLMPSRSYASELLKIAQKGDIGMRHIQLSNSENGGPLQLSIDYYALDGQQKLTDQYGNQILVNGDGAIQLHADGSAEFQKTNGHPRQWFTSSLDELISKNVADSRAKVSVDRGIVWKDRNVDRFTIDRDFIDGAGNANHSHTTLVADRETQRPLEMDTKLSSGLLSVEKWDYPAPDLRVFSLPKLDKSRMYDLEAERDEIRQSLAGSGVKATVAGHTVELMQLWIDERGGASAIARADYAYPENFGLHIDGKAVSSEPETDPFSGRYRIHPPTALYGQSVQAFFGFRKNSDPTHSRTSQVALLEIPVFDGQKLVGYAKFSNVPVHRTWEIGFLIEPINLPFWADQPKGASTTVAAETPIRP